MERDELLRALVKPLTWTSDTMQSDCGFYLAFASGAWRPTDEGYRNVTGIKSLEAARGACDEHNRARIAEALRLDLIAGLVGTATRYADRYMRDEADDPDLCVPGQHDDARAVFASLAAIRAAGGEVG